MPRQQCSPCWLLRTPRANSSRPVAVTAPAINPTTSSKYRGTLDHRVVVYVQNVSERVLIAARQVPRYRHTVASSLFEDDPVSLAQLRQRQPASEWIVDVRIGASLVQDDVAVGHRLDNLRNGFQEAVRLRAGNARWRQRCSDEPMTHPASSRFPRFRRPSAGRSRGSRPAWQGLLRAVRRRRPSGR